jgi:hypothetical protein
MHTGYVISIALVVLIIILTSLVFTNQFCNRFDLFPIDLCYKSSEGAACGESQKKAIEFSRHGA